jgi:prophage regulatory protein
LQNVSNHSLQRRLEGGLSERILRDSECRHRTGLSRTTRWRLIRTGKFPKPVKLTEQAIGWRQSEVDEWLASRSRAGDQP